MRDLIEYQYWLGEMLRLIPELEVELKEMQSFRESILEDMKPLLEQLKPYQDDLAYADTEIADIKQHLKQIQEPRLIHVLARQAHLL